ncbi:MAG: response regulator transcription factor [Planctomycetia bacterium]|jgi:two-component system alkaline phosphatase synthesis response regulator PhoP
MSKKPRILVVEDEEALAIGLQHALAREGYEVVLARDGAAAQQALRDASHDLVLLDVMLPRKSGFEVLAQLRREGRSVPVVMLTSKNEEIDKVQGLDLGADDYMTKPFSLAELLARVRARLRRSTAREEDVVELQLGPARIDLRAMRVELDGRVDELSLREVDMLKLLWRERGRPVARERFLEEVWGHERFPTTRTVDQHMVKLRQKVERDPADPKHLLTAFGVGYRLEP